MKVLAHLAGSLALAALLLGGPAAQASTGEPAELMALARSGAPGLALHLLERRQPERLRDPASWLRWEDARLSILLEARRWQELAARVEGLPTELPGGFLAEAWLRQAEAYLGLEQPGQARRALRRVVWSTPGGPEPGHLAAARLMIVSSYLAEGRDDDARVALLRYRQDYPGAAEQEQLSYARLLVRVGEYRAAADLLAADLRAEAVALGLLANLRAGGDAKAITDAAQKLAEAESTGAVDRARLWAVAAESAAALDQGARRAWCLERALMLREALLADPIFVVRGDALWDAYLALGQHYGNRAQLLIGDDAAWLRAAEKAQAEKGLVRSRALLAVVAQEGAAAEARAQAHRRLAESLLSEEGGEATIQGLYLDAERYRAVATVPTGLRHFLVDRALADGQLQLASDLIADLATPPEGVDPFAWTLKRARVLILAGREDAGIDALYELLASVPVLDRDSADRLLQVVFDLQTVKRHEAAINLFIVLMPRVSEAQQRRELLFWQADSHKALGQYEQAAWLYLRSATLLDRHAYDPWAQTCRYNAAEALAEAGLVADARRLYQDLLRATREPERRAVLRHRLQSLELLD
jgi:hypothetical protein